MEYPNLELLEYKAKESLYNSDFFKQKYENYCTEHQLNKKYSRPRLVAHVFLQTWPDTATGIDKDNCFAGQAFTDAYTTVFHEAITDTYVIFFGNKHAYTIYDATETFYNDLASFQLKSQKEAKKYY